MINDKDNNDKDKCHNIIAAIILSMTFLYGDLQKKGKKSKIYYAIF